MNQVIESRPLHTYAEPLAGLRVSWGAILAGALATMGVALLLWALALAIVLTASTATLHSFRADAMTLWVCAMATTLVGAAVGGSLSGFLPGNPRRLIGGVHAFLGWATAFIAVTLISGLTLGAALRTSIMAGARTNEEAAARGTRFAENEGAINALESLGYPRGEAIAMLRRSEGALTNDGRGAPPAPQRDDTTASTLVDWSAGLAWSWFGTWAAAAVIATGAGISATRRLRMTDTTRDDVAWPPSPTWPGEPSGVVR